MGWSQKLAPAEYCQQIVFKPDYKARF